MPSGRMTAAHDPKADLYLLCGGDIFPARTALIRKNVSGMAALMLEQSLKHSPPGWKGWDISMYGNGSGKAAKAWLACVYGAEFGLLELDSEDHAELDSADFMAFVEDVGSDPQLSTAPMRKTYQQMRAAQQRQEQQQRAG